MNHGFQLFPDSATAHARDVDTLYFFLLLTSGFFIFLIAGAILYFAVRYRRLRQMSTPQPLLTNLPLELTWIVVPLAISLAMFFWGAKLFFIGQSPPDGAMEIHVVGKQWMWKIQHPGGRGEINELHVPVGHPMKLLMVSEDVIHSFYVPAFRVKQDVLPGRYSTLWFRPDKPGEYHLFCAEYCGTEHSQMIGRVVVLEPADFQRWLAGSLDARPVAEQGEWLFSRFRCDSCHGTRDNPGRGPALAGRFGNSVQLADGGKTDFDAQYVRESIVDPQAKIAAGYPQTMPTYAGQLSESDILAIVDYLKSKS